MSDNTLKITAVPEAPKLLDQLRERIRLKHYSIRTEQSYVQWVRRYIIFHGKRHPAEMGKRELEAFLTSLAVERNVSAATQTQALSALAQRMYQRQRLGSRLPCYGWCVTVLKTP
jgi:hypothetical protein